MLASEPYLVATVPSVIPTLAKLPTYVPDAEIPEITPPPMVRLDVRA